jgi:hypothetical protein
MDLLQENRIVKRVTTIVATIRFIPVNGEVDTEQVTRTAD